MTQPVEQFVDALNGVFGVHPGARASHAKGVCVAGEFVPSGAAAAFTVAAHLQRQRSTVIGRFSVGGGNPRASDKAKTVRGLALRFEFGAGRTTDLVMISAPVFFVAKAEHFIGFMEARRPDPATGKPDPERIRAFNDAHPDTRPQIEYLSRTAVPASYGTTAYWAVNAFKFTGAHAVSIGRAFRDRLS